MSDKTCGECKWFARVPGCASRGACLRYDDYGTFVLRESNYDACDGGYEERGESVEQVAREMLGEIEEMCAKCSEDHCANLDDLGWHGQCPFFYGDRLKALGVVE